MDGKHKCVGGGRQETLVMMLGAHKLSLSWLFGGPRTPSAAPVYDAVLQHRPRHGLRYCYCRAAASTPSKPGTSGSMGSRAG